MTSLAPFHTFGLNASCEALYTASTTEAFLSYYAANDDKPIWLLGEGSNCVFVEDFDGCVIKVAFKGVRHWQDDTHHFLEVGAGENWHQLVQWCLSQGIRGFENLALVPGTVGAAPIQNIGAYGVEVARFIEGVHVVDLHDGSKSYLPGEACEFGYRSSIFKTRLADKILITSVCFALPKAWHPIQHYGELQRLEKPDAQQIFSAVCDIRRAKLPAPAQIGNAGSFFKNPVVENPLWQSLHEALPHMPYFLQPDGRVKIPAAWLIDNLGYKNKPVGGIRAHQNQPLVLTNDGSGTGSQLLELAGDIVDSVRKEFGITLENEVRIVGRRGLISL